MKPGKTKGSFVPEPGFQKGGNRFRNTSATKKFVAPEERFGPIVTCRAVLKCRMDFVECIEMSGERHGCLFQTGYSDLNFISYPINESEG